jgi:hypothetical protein
MFNIAKFADLYNVRKAMEIGVGPVAKCRLLEMIESGYECHLVEGLPRFQNQIRRCLSAKPNVKLHPVIISNEVGTEQLFDRGEGSWITKLPDSPDTMNNGVSVDPKYCTDVEAITLDMIDPGDIDMMLIDTEGAEWYALERMISRPRVIVIETHLIFHEYINPYMTEIEAWMSSNGYTKLATEQADTMWVI